MTSNIFEVSLACYTLSHLCPPPFIPLLLLQSSFYPPPEILSSSLLFINLFILFIFIPSFFLSSFCLSLFIPSAFSFHPFVSLHSFVILLLTFRPSPFILSSSSFHSLSPPFIHSLFILLFLLLMLALLQPLSFYSFILSPF